MSDSLIRLRRIAHPMVWIATAALILLPLGLFVAFLAGTYGETWLRAQFDFVTLPEVIPAVGWAVSRLIAALSLVLVLVALWQMRTLFSLYAMGDVFGAEAALTIRRIGTTLLALAVVGIVGHTAVILALTSANPPGERALSIGFNSNQIFLIFAAFLLIAIGWAMSEAARLAEENRGFV